MVERDEAKLARREKRDRLAYVSIRMKEITEEKKRLIAERTALIAEVRAKQAGKVGKQG